MHIYGVCANYNKMKENNQYKEYSIYIDGRPKACGNVAKVIKNTRLRSTNKLPFVCLRSTMEIKLWSL